MPCCAVNFVFILYQNDERLFKVFSKKVRNYEVFNGSNGFLSAQQYFDVL